MPKNVESCAIASMSDVWECYRLELIAVEDQIRQNLDSKVALVNTVAAHILNSGGKRIRPLLLMLCARLAGYTGRDDVILASPLEYIPTAPLLHDDVVEYKTGSLIAAACRIGAVVADADPALRDALYQFGQAIGVAFQVADDTLDYAAPRESLGKSQGKDLGEGNVTLPLLHLRKHCTEAERMRLVEVMEKKSNGNGGLAWVVSLMERYGSIDYAMATARGFVQAAKVHLALFEDSVHKRALQVVADYMVSRDH